MEVDPGVIKESELSSRPHVLYRFFGLNDELLYVGITCDVGSRWNRHADDKPWWAEVSRTTLAHFPDRSQVLDAETRAIAEERPKYNIRGRTPRSPGRIRMAEGKKSTRIPRIDGIDRSHLARDSLVGSFFLFGPDPGWQGCIVAEPSPGLLLVELFSWLDGSSTEQRLIRVADMADWSFYDDAEWMRDSYEHTYRLRWEQQREKERKQQ